MARFFANDGLVTCSTGGLSGLDGGPVTIAAIVKLTDSVNGAALYAGSSTSTVSFAMENFNNDWYFTGSAGGKATVSGRNTDNWHLASVSKATGTATPRGHKYVYDTNTFTHTDAASSLADSGTTPGGGGVVQIGRFATTEYMNTDIAIVAVWDRVLTDAEIEELPFSLQAWYASAPVGGWLLDQASTATKVLDWTGNGANETGLTNTSVSTNSLPVFSYGRETLVLSSSASAGGPTNVVGSDTGTLTDTSSLAVSISTSDTAALADASSLAVTISTSDTSTVADVASLLASLTGTDTGALTEGTSSAGVEVVGSDTFTLAETSSLAVTISTSDSAGVTDVSSLAGNSLTRTLRPPTVDEGLWAHDPLFGRYRIARGVTLLVSGSTVTAVQYPSQEGLDAYDHVYLGGHVYEITDAEAAVLIAAGYGAYIT